MKRLLALTLALMMALSLAACGQRGLGLGKMTTAEIDALFESSDIFEFWLDGDSAYCRIPEALVTESGATARPFLEKSADGKEFTDVDDVYRSGLTPGDDRITFNYSGLPSDCTYRIRLDILKGTKIDELHIFYTRYSEALYLPPPEPEQPEPPVAPEPPADTASDAVPPLAELLPAELVFSCGSTDKAEIGRAAMDYYLGLFDERMPEYYRLVSYQVNDVRLDRIGEGKFGVRLSYDFVSCGGYHIACNSEDFAPNDPTDDARLLHGLTVRGEGRYVDIEELGGDQYKIINIYTGGYTEGMAPVNEDGTLEGSHYLMLVRGDDRRTLKLETPIPEYLRLNSYKMSTEAVGFSMPETEIRALPEYLTLDGDCYIYQNAAGDYLFQYSGLVRHILTAAEYAALVALAETA